jgi:aspartyl/asparaginyl beta-hydroxylase (cupin superfamily)
MQIYFIIIAVLILIYYLRSWVWGDVSSVSIMSSGKVRAKRFYTPAEVFPELEKITHAEITGEVSNIINGNWVDWPEKDLWDAGNTGSRWTIFPLIAFGRRVESNCARMPSTMRFINDIDRQYGVSIAILSRLGPGMKLVPHQGWGAHSNNVLRCHYGVIVPTSARNKRVRDCRIEVADEITDKCVECVGTGSVSAVSKQGSNCKCYDGYVYESRRHSEGEWIIFDDSKLHFAENNTAGDRIVLIMDIVRPERIPLGTSNVQDTTELKSIIAEYEKIYT